MNAFVSSKLAKNQRNPLHPRRAGLTIIELLVVIALSGILLALAIPAISQARQAARKSTCLNRIRNLAFGITQYDHFHRRLPPSGTYWHNSQLDSHPQFSWAVFILPFIGEENLYHQIQFDTPLDTHANQVLYHANIPVLTCPSDITLNPTHESDLSFAVNGGIGFTTRTMNGEVRDCPVSPDWIPIDLNGDGTACSGNSLDDDDRKIFKSLGLFFLETQNSKVTKRHHALAEVIDGTSQTFMIAENIRTGFNPHKSQSTFADPAPHQSSFFIGNPCRHYRCGRGDVDYQKSNMDSARINSGLRQSEGTSAVPNSFHPGGVHMAFADGHVTFLSESIDGSIYAALASPQGRLLDQSPLSQQIFTGDLE